MALNYVIDACSLINLNNADSLDAACQLRGCDLWVSPIVIGECQPTCAATIMRLHNGGQLHVIDDNQIPSNIFLDLLFEYQLGDGETEAVAAARHCGFGLCCDDRQARNLGKKILGTDKVVGSLHILKLCVEEDLFNCSRASELLTSMQAAGGFLPSMSNSYFCGGVPGC